MIGTTMAYAGGQGHAGAAFAALAGALLIQIGTNFSTTILTISKVLTMKNVWALACNSSWISCTQNDVTNFFTDIRTCGIGRLVSSLSRRWPIVIIGLLSIASGYFTQRAHFHWVIWDWENLFVLIFFGPIAVCGTFYVQALEVTEIVFYAGLGPGLLATALLVVNNLRDEPTDRKAGKLTLAVRFGTLLPELNTLYFYVRSYAT